MRLAAAIVMVVTAGCGRAAGDGYSGEALGVVQGEVSNPRAVSTSGRVDLALGWAGARGAYLSLVSQQTSVTPVFPAAFRIELDRPPPADALAPVVDSSGPTVTGHEAVGFVMAYGDDNGNGVMDLPGPDNGYHGDTLLGASMSMVAYLEGRETPGGHPSMRLLEPGFSQVSTPCSAEEELAAWDDLASNITASSPLWPAQCQRQVVPIDTPITVQLGAAARLPMFLCFYLADMLPTDQMTYFTPTCDADGRGYRAGMCMDEAAPWAAMCFDHGCWRPHFTLAAGADAPRWWPCKV